MKNYDAYIFDLYGTLIDIHTDEYALAFWRKIRELFHMYGAEYDTRELRNAYFETIRKQEKQRAQEGHLIEIEISEVFQEMFKKKGIVPDEKRIKEIAWQFRQSSTSHLRLYVGAKELLETLRFHGRKIYLLSNAQCLFTVPELKETGLYELFDDIVISSDVGYRKPDILIFKYLLKKQHLDPENCLMIGNDLLADAAGATEAGMDSYYIRSALSGSDDHVMFHPTYHQDHMDLRLLKRNLLSES